MRIYFEKNLVKVFSTGGWGVSPQLAKHLLIPHTWEYPPSRLLSQKFYSLHERLIHPNQITIFMYNPIKNSFVAVVIAFVQFLF